MNNNILIVGIILLFVLSALAPITFGSNISTIDKGEPLNAEEWILEITCKGGFSVYRTNVTNVGNVTFNGRFGKYIYTDTWFMIWGKELNMEPVQFDIAPGESVEFIIGAVLGFGPASISIAGTFQPDGGDIYPFYRNGKGFVLLFRVFYNMDPVTLRE